MKTLLILTTILALTGLFEGCATPISNNKGGIQISPTGRVGVDLLEAAYNLDNAIAIGVLPADDPAAACVHDVLQKTGVEAAAGTPAVQSFVPKVSLAASAGSVAYIRAQQLRSLKGIEVSIECKGMIGQFVVDGIHDVKTTGGIAAWLLK